MGGVVKVIGELTKAQIDVITTPGKLLADRIRLVGGIIEKVPGLESLGREVERWGKDYKQTIKVISGEYRDDVKKVEKYKRALDKRGDYLESRINQYNVSLDELIDRLEGLIAFDEIFKMAMSNRIRNYQESEGPELEILVQEYQLMMMELKRMIAQLKSEYDFVIGLTEGPFIQRIIGSLIMIIGGLVSDMKDIYSGNATSTEWKNVITAIVIVIVIVLSWGAALAPGAGMLAMTTAVLTTIAGLMTLDGMYANGAATGAIMSTLDFLFNDVLNLDDLIGSDFKHFDKDNKDYQQMVMYTKLAISLTALATAWGSSLGSGAANGSKAAAEGATAGTAGAEAGANAGTEAAAKAAEAGTDKLLQIGETMDTSYFLGVKFTTYGEVYKIYSHAQDIYDAVTAHNAYKAIKEQLNADIQKLNEAIYSKTNKNMMKHYKDCAYFLQDQQEYIDRYIWSMTAINMYVDPYGTTPVANIRFQPDDDTRTTSFGYEDVFDESTQAGSKGYFNSIIYGG